MARYSIDGQILSDIADGIREKDVPKVLVSDYDWDWSYTNTGYSWYYNLTIPDATTIKLINVNNMADGMDFFTPGLAGSFVIAPYRISKAYDYFDKPSDVLYYSPASEKPPQELVFETDTIGFSVDSAGTGKTTYTISAHVIAYDADGNIIGGRIYRDAPKAGITPEQMVDSLNDLPSVPVEAFNLTGSCSNKFAYGNGEWMVKLYGDRFITDKITAANSMFYQCKELEYIPFTINCASSKMSFSSMFYENYNLKEVPKITGKPIVSSMEDIFYCCYNLRYLPEDIDDWFDWTEIDTKTTNRGDNTFNSCYSLRSVPMNFLNHNNPKNTYYFYCVYGSLFSACYSLDEIVGLPIPRASEIAWSSNMFNTTFNGCSRIKNMTFATNEDGSPIVVNWKNQIIDLSQKVGYVYGIYNVLNHNSGITADKEVIDDATYQALKNDPDWFSQKEAYSRYNHTSAVATINSLPDTTSSGGTNTIKFLGAAGSATDGGAINTLTEEEIAVATAKGWTVSLV